LFADLLWPRGFWPADFFTESIRKFKGVKAKRRKKALGCNAIAEYGTSR
jgi:hypothetical protein